MIHVSAEEGGDVGIEIEDGEFNWHTSDTESRTLTGINLRVKRGSRVAVCGTVGSGKTSLLSAVLGEIPKLAGTVSVLQLPMSSQYRLTPFRKKRSSLLFLLMELG